jgi:hypothetical protein
VPELLEVGDEPSGLAFGVAFGELVAARVAVDLAGGEVVPGRDEHRMRDGGDCAGVPSAGAQLLVLGLEVGVFGAGVGGRGFEEVCA